MKNTPMYLWWVRRGTSNGPMRRNPLCRPSDRLQQISAWACSLIALLTITVVSIAIVPAVADSWSPPVMRPTTAVAQRVTEVPHAIGAKGAHVGHEYDVGVRWVSETGVARESSVRMPGAPARGATVRIWATASGDSVAGTRPRSTRGVDTIFLVINAVWGIGLAGFAAHRLLVWRLDRRRLRAWDAELEQLLTPH